MKNFRIIVLITFTFFILFQISNIIYAQQAPTYSFINFDTNYQKLKSNAENDGYKIEENEIKSVFGQSLLYLSKSMNFYVENIYLFFNEKKELIYFSVDFSLKQNQPRRILEELYSSIINKLVEKYGENENTNFPFYKVIGNQYEIFMHPFQAYSNSVEVSFKDIEKYSQYQTYYNQQIKKLETKDINQTVNKF